jgi:ABC-type nitrate/sulfonate/bicarbonate transport system permease component
MAVATRDEVKIPAEMSRSEKFNTWMRDNVPSFVVLAVTWELIALYVDEPALFPRILPILRRAHEVIFLLAGDTVCVLCVHSMHTAWRILIGMSIAAVIGTALGIAMGRVKWFEKFMVPILSMLLPIPALAWSPILVLWFGLGNTTMVFITAFAAALPVISSTWTGVKTVNPVWIRAAKSMNAERMTLFWKVIFPAALPFILSGFRIGLARAWRAGIAGEMVAASDWGLGYAIFDSREELDTTFMLVGIATIALVGFVMEKFIFEKFENVTVVKWGMLAETGRSQ